MQTYSGILRFGVQWSPSQQTLYQLHHIGCRTIHSHVIRLMLLWFRCIAIWSYRTDTVSIASYLMQNNKFVCKEKKKEIWPSPMTKPPIPTENSKTKGQQTQTPPKTSITQRLRTDLGRSVGVTSNPTGVVKPVYGIPTFPLTAKAV